MSKCLFLFALIAVAAAVEVEQCPGLDIEGLSEKIHMSPCKKPPCRLKKGTDQQISIDFTPDKDVNEVINHVAADVFGVSLPFVGVDGKSVCDKIFTEDGNQAKCPLKAGNKYTYKDSFPILSFYPSIPVKVHWALKNGKKVLNCFEIQARIV